MNTVVGRPWSDRLKNPALALLVIYWLCMFVGTHIPQHDLIVPEQISDKLVHAVAYAGLTVLLLLNLFLRTSLRWYHGLIVVLTVAAVGIFDELTQIPVGREFDLVDWAADMIGALTGLAIVAISMAVHRRIGRGLQVRGRR